MIERTSISLESDVMALLRRLAEVDHRDVSNMIAVLVLESARGKGWIGPADEPKKKRRGGRFSEVT